MNVTLLLDDSSHGWNLFVIIPIVCYISSVHKLLGNFSATLGFFSTFQLVVQLSVHRTTLNFCVSIVSHASAASETIKKCRIQLMSRIYLSNLLIILLGRTCLYEKMSRRNKKL